MAVYGRQEFGWVYIDRLPSRTDYGWLDGSDGVLEYEYCILHPQMINKPESHRAFSPRSHAHSMCRGGALRPYTTWGLAAGTCWRSIVRSLNHPALSIPSRTRSTCNTLNDSSGLHGIAGDIKYLYIVIP